jgi:hypothetical protein
MGVLLLVPSGFDRLHRFSRAVLDRLRSGTGSIFVTHNTAVLIAILSQG